MELVMSTGITKIIQDIDRMDLTDEEIEMIWFMGLSEWIDGNNKKEENES